MDLKDILSVRAYQCLIRNGIKTVEDLINSSEEDIPKFKNIGERASNEVILLKNKLGNKSVIKT